MTNQYLQEFRELQERGSFKAQTWFGHRQQLVEEYSWAVPTDEVIEYLASFDELTEIGAGNGYWAALIEAAGGSVEAYDSDPPEETYTTVQQCDEELTELQQKIETGPVLMVWPPYDSPMSEIVADARPSDILYVGESRGGCTGTDEFFGLLQREYAIVEEKEIPSYEGVLDNFYHFGRKL